MYHTETAAVDGTAACAHFAPLPSARRDMPDATLIARITTGDRLAIHALFAHHKTRVYRFILRVVGDAASADDLTSEVFLTVWRHAHKFRGRAAASAWLLAIARFKALDELRRRRDDARNLEELDASDPAADPEASWADNHRGAMLRKCLGHCENQDVPRTQEARRPARRAGGGGSHHAARSSEVPIGPARASNRSHEMRPPKLQPLLAC